MLSASLNKTLPSFLQDAARQKEKHNIHLQAYRKRVADLESWLDEMKVRHATSALPMEGPEALQEQLQDNRVSQHLSVVLSYKQLNDSVNSCRTTG